MGWGPIDSEARVEVNSYSPVGIGALLVVDAFSDFFFGFPVDSSGLVSDG